MKDTNLSEMMKHPTIPRGAMAQSDAVNLGTGEDNLSNLRTTLSIRNTTE